MFRNSPSYRVEKYIEVDAAHRVPLHESKCRNLHGHRYRVTARVEATELGAGAQDGMVLDFGFIKKLLVDFIDTYCDHGVILSCKDHDMLQLAFSNLTVREREINARQLHESLSRGWRCWCGYTTFGKTFVIPYVPTAENLARFWYEMLKDRVTSISQGRATLAAIAVRETPTSEASFPIQL